MEKFEGLGLKDVQRTQSDYPWVDATLLAEVKAERVRSGAPLAMRTVRT